MFVTVIFNVFYVNYCYFHWADKTFMQISFDFGIDLSLFFLFNFLFQNETTQTKFHFPQIFFFFLLNNVTPFSYLATFRFQYNTVYTSNTTLLYASSLSFVISTNAFYYNTYIYLYRYMHLFQFSALLKSVDFI